MIELSSGTLKATIAPELGGVVMSLAHNGRDILRPAPSRAAVAADPREAACYPCVPWFGRLFGGLDFAGVHYELDPTLPACDPDNALHGTGWINPWKLTSQTETTAACRFTHVSAARQFPFAFSAFQEFALIGDTFTITLSVVNQSGGPMPAGLGLHPFFPCTSETRIRLNEANAAIPEEEIDHTTPNWNGAADIIDGDRRLSLRSTAERLHIFSPEAADFVCLEPISHAPGNFGQDVLAPGEEMSLWLSIAPQIR